MNNCDTNTDNINGNVENDNLINDLNDAAAKLEYIIQLGNNNSSNSNIKQAIITKYLNEIKTNICNVTQKIDDAYTTLHDCETNNDLDYTTLFTQIQKDVNNEKNFINAFGPSITMWSLAHTLAQAP